MWRSVWRRGLAWGLILATGMLGTVSPALSTENASFSGRVFRADGITPRSGVVVGLLDEEAGKIFRSEPTDDEGKFEIDTAPAGSYTVVTEAPEGAFLAAEEIRLDAGSNRPLALTLNPTPSEGQMAPAQASGSQQGPSKLVKGIIAGVIGLAALWIFDELTEDKEESASDF